MDRSLRAYLRAKALEFVRTYGAAKRGEPIGRTLWRFARRMLLGTLVTLPLFTLLLLAAARRLAPEDLPSFRAGLFAAVFLFSVAGPTVTFAGLLNRSPDLEFLQTLSLRKGALVLGKALEAGMLRSLAILSLLPFAIAVASTLPPAALAPFACALGLLFVLGFASGFCLAVALQRFLRPEARRRVVGALGVLYAAVAIAVFAVILGAGESLPRLLRSLPSPVRLLFAHPVLPHVLASGSVEAFAGGQFAVAGRALAALAVEAALALFVASRLLSDRFVANLSLERRRPLGDLEARLFARPLAAALFFLPRVFRALVRKDLLLLARVHHLGVAAALILLAGLAFVAVGLARGRPADFHLWGLFAVGGSLHAIAANFLRIETRMLDFHRACGVGARRLLAGKCLAASFVALGLGAFFETATWALAAPRAGVLLGAGEVALVVSASLLLLVYLALAGVLGQALFGEFTLRDARVEVRRGRWVVLALTVGLYGLLAVVLRAELALETRALALAAAGGYGLSIVTVGFVRGVRRLDRLELPV